MAQKPLILNRSRFLGDIISDAFVFAKRNYKVVGELFLILVLPILLIGIYNLYFIFQDINFLDPDPNNTLGDFGGLKMFLGYGFLMIGFLLFYYIITSTAICYVRNDNDTPERQMVTDFMKDNAMKYLLYFFAMVGALIAIIAVAAASAFISPVLTALLVVILFVFLFYLLPILSILPFLYLDQNLGFGDAVRKTLEIIRGQWWATFGTIFVTNMIGSFASYILIIPIYAIMMVQLFSAVDGGGTDSMGFWTSILMIVSIISSSIILIYTIGAVALKYYDLTERKDNTSLKSRIDEIGRSDRSMFENDGEF